MSQSRIANQVSPFSYLDYRDFLNDWYKAAKQTRAGMSYRKFSERAGLKSWNFIMMVLQGKRNLSQESIPKVAKALKLNKQETEFFENLVHYTQEEHQRDKERYYQRMLRSRKYNQLEPIRTHQYEYCSRWYHAVIRELITAKEYDGTAEWIAERIFPKVSVADVTHSLELLETLGFAKRNKKGRWKQSHSLVSTGADVRSIELFAYHYNMLELTKEVLDTVPGERRDISALTLGVRKERLEQLKKKVQKFRQDILKFVSADETPEEVVQVNIHMFPLTSPKA